MGRYELPTPYASTVNIWVSLSHAGYGMGYGDGLPILQSISIQ